MKLVMLNIIGMNCFTLNSEYMDMYMEFASEIRFSYININIYFSLLTYSNHLLNIHDPRDESELGLCRLISRNILLKQKISELKDRYELLNRKHRAQNSMEENTPEQITDLN